MLMLPLVGTFYQCSETASTPPANAQFVSASTPEEINRFGDYWYTGEAELSTYAIEQERYGEIRSGEVVNIFVTEDFSQEKQVKLDDPASAGADKVTVLKLNQIKRFQTGIYDYSLMLSVFTPVSADRFPHTLKTTMSSQDWCGQSFSQINHQRADRYRLRGYSYFESEGDIDQTLQSDLLEDELWNRIRIAPERIPTGSLRVVPGNMFLRMRHVPERAETASLTLSPATDGQRTLTLAYESIDRNLAITFETTSPHRILNWTETYDGQNRVTAHLKKTIRSPYWQQNARKFDFQRDTLGL